MLLALDPGMNSPGIATFSGERLIYAGRAAIPREVADLDPGARWLHVARRVYSTVRAHGIPPLERDLTVVFERPQWYQRGKSKGDPNDLVGVAGVAACLIGIASCHFASLTVRSPTPAEWIGQLPKTCRACKANKKKCTVCLGSAWNTPRGRYIASRLSQDELALTPDQNDAIDAVGLGLYELNRLKPHVVLSNGRDGR